MDVRWLETFMAVVREGSFAGAADELRYARSTVTHQLRNLERSLGAQLFDREVQGQPLTRAGEAMVHYAETLLETVEQARSELTSSERSTPLTLGTTETTCAYRLPAFLRSLARRLPDLRVSVEVGSAPDISDRLKRGRIVAALLSARAEAGDGPGKRLWEERPILVSASAGVTTPRRVLITRPGCPYRALVEEEYLRDDGESDRLDLGTIEGVKGGVLNGLGIGVIPLVAARPALEQGTLRQLPWRPEAAIETRLQWDKGRVGGAVHAYFDSLRAAV